MWNYIMQICRLNRLRNLFFFLLLSSTLHTFAQSKSELLEDLDFLYSNVLNIHPEPFQHISKNRFEKMKKQIAKKLNKDCSIEKFYTLTAPLVAALQDGHSVMTIPVTKNRISYLNNGGLVFPLRLEIDSLNRFIVKANMSQCINIKTGDEIISINGIKSKSVINQFQQLIGGENNVIKSIQLRDYISTLLWYFYHFEDSYNLEVNQEGKINRYHIDGISPFVAKSKMKSLLPSNSIKDFNLSISKNKATLKIKSFYDTRRLTDFLYDSFSIINSTGVDSLVIDLKDNLGGRSASLDTLLSFLSNKPYELYSKIDLKVSDKVKMEYIKHANPLLSVINSMNTGSVYSYSSGIVYANKGKNIFKGHVDVILNMASYSASLTFASSIRALKRGRLLGYTNYQDSYCGDFVLLTLPNSKLEVYLSTKKFYNCKKMVDTEKP